MGTIKEIQTIDDLAFSKELVQELILKAIYVHGELSGRDISNLLKIKFNIFDHYWCTECFIMAGIPGTFFIVK